MADMFYFRSPSQPLLTKYRPNLRHKLKACKRRRSGKMDGQMERACVVQVDESLFCPIHIGSLLSDYQLNGLAELQQPKRGKSTEADHSSQISNEYDPPLYQGSSNPLDEPIAPTHRWSYPSSAPRLHHPRPDSHDIAQEEDGRRTRFALEDIGEYPSLLQRLLHMTPIPDDTTPATDVLDGAMLQSYETREGSSTSGLPTVYPYGFDDDALAVDDARRSYDFKDFIQRLIPDDDRMREDFEPPQGLSSFLPASSDDVTRADVKNQTIDIEGLRWNKLRMNRNQVLEMRKQQHPSQGIPLPYRAFPPLGNTAIDTTSITERHFRFRSSMLKHRAHYSHYQLRNVLAATSRNDIFFSTGRQVIQTSLTCSSIERNMMDLSSTPTLPSGMRITCLSAQPSSQFPSYNSNKVLLAGGFNGEYALLNLNSNQPTPIEGFVTHDYNGLVTHVSTSTDRCTGQLSAAFCSNDCKIRLLDISSNRFTNTFSYEHAANCSATSPDGRLRVLVGDSNETLITDVEKGEILVSLSRHTDHGFSCAWSDDGRYIATGAQDGLVVLWDARNWATPLRTERCVMATARSLQFTSGGALVVGEDDDVVTIYDTKCAEARQDIRFFGSVAGVAVLDDGNELVVANADKTVGGLMSFSRMAHGRNGGRLGEGADCMWPCYGRGCRYDRSAEWWRSDGVSEVLV